jgi:hypothetical protein
MLSRMCSTVLIVLLAAGLAIGQSTENREKGAIDDQKKVENPDLSNPEKPTPPDGPISVISPNGKETWNEGSIQTVEWKVRAKVQVDSVQIRLIEDVGMKTIEPRIVDLAVVKGNPGKWIWEGVSPPMEQCKIEVHAFSQEKILLTDDSNGPFTIARDLIPIDDPKPDAKAKEKTESNATEE